MSAIRLVLVALIALSLSSMVFAWGAYVPETYQSNQVYAGSFYKPSTQIQGWNYYAYYPNSGYPVMGGGRIYPPGYLGGSYGVYSTYPSYGYNYGHPAYGAPVHTTVDFYYKSGNFSIGCTIYSC